MSEEVPSAEFGPGPAPAVEFGPGPAPPLEFGDGLLLSPPELDTPSPEGTSGERRPPRARLTFPSAPKHRRLLYAVAGVAAAALAAAVVAIALLGGGGSAPAAPADTTAALVPADALAYLHVDLDRDRPAGPRLLATLRRLPDWQLFGTVLLGRLTAIVSGGGAVPFATSVQPWLGREAAFALLDTPGRTAGTLFVLDVSKPEMARAFLRSHGVLSAGSYDGVQLLSYSTGTSLALVSHYLVLGQAASVRAAISAYRGGRSLSSATGFQRALASHPADEVLAAYASGAGMRRLLEARRGLIGLLGTLLDSPALIGVGITVAPSAGGLHVLIHRALDPTLQALGAAPQPPFTPTMASLLPAGSLGLLDVRGLDHLLGRLLSTGSGGGLGGKLGGLIAQLGTALTAEGINVSDLTSLLDGETAVALIPGGTSTDSSTIGASGSSGTGSGRGGAAGPGVRAAARSASLLILARTSDEQQARDELAALEAPLAQLFPPPVAGPGRAAVFNDVAVAGITAHQLLLTPGLEFDYAVFNGLVAVSTSLDGIAAAASVSRRLPDVPGFRSVLPARTRPVTSLLFLDFSQLLSLGERTGLTRGTNLHSLRPDLEKIRAIGLTTSGGEAETTAELYLQIP